MIEINELELKKYDSMFGTQSRVFPPNLIWVETPLEEWQIIITNKRHKHICLLHKNKCGNTNRFHKQSWKNSLFACYDSIYTHKNILPCVKNNGKL